MRRTHRILTAVTLLTLAALPLHAAVYMKIEGVKGRVTAAGREKWIELNSMQFMGDGSVRGVMQASLGELCTSRAALPNVTFDKDGQTHELRNVSFRDCEQVGTDTKVVFTYTVCNTHSATPRDHHLGGGSTPARKRYDHTLGGGAFSPNAKLIGAGAAPVAIQLESLTLNGNTAKLAFVKAGTGTLVLSAQQKLPSLIVELATGQKWELEDVLVTSWSTSAAESRPMEMLALNFTKVEGSSAGFQARR